MRLSLKISKHEFLLFQRLILDRCGIFIAEDKAFLLESRLSKLMVENRVNSFINLYHLILENKTSLLTQKLIDAITTKETFWFRDKTPWLVLEEKLLPHYIELINSGKTDKITIWSAACATGQEPYSIAMCIDKHLKQKQAGNVTLNNFKILATDISAEALSIAQKGVYDEVSMNRGLDNYFKSGYFTKTGRHWTINDRMRKAVEFKKYNLLEAYCSVNQFDIIFCRHVTIYFSEQYKQEVLNKMAAALKPNGILFLGNAEILPASIISLKPEMYKNNKYYRV